MPEIVDAFVRNAQGIQAVGPVAQLLMQGARLDPGLKRPFIGNDGNSYVSIYAGGDPENSSSWRTVTTQQAGLTNNAMLRREEWMRLDEAVLKISEKRLGGVQDLMSRGLVYNLGNGLANTVLEYHDMGDAMEAEMSMDAITRTRADQVSFGVHYLPLPIIHVDYNLNARVLAVSRNMGQPLDVLDAERATRRVLEKQENMLFTDETYGYGGGTIYSYVNHPDRNTRAISAWNGAGKTGAQIVTDVLNMKQDLIDDLHFGPYTLYIPTGYETKLDEDYSTAKGSNTIRERLMKISNIEKILVIDSLASTTVLLVQMTSDVVRAVVGMALQNLEWKSEGGLVTNYKVMTIWVPQIRSDQNGASGLLHATAS